MSRGYAVRASIRCQEHRQLMRAFAEAVKELVELHQQQFEAAINDDPDSKRFDLLIHMALEKKTNAKYAYMSHVEVHGCSNANVITNRSGTGSN